MKALGQIRARRARGRGMSIAGIVLGMTGVLATPAAWTYFLSTLYCIAGASCIFPEDLPGGDTLPSKSRRRSERFRSRSQPRPFAERAKDIPLLDDRRSK